jgi:hypothetical protein
MLKRPGLAARGTAIVPTCFGTAAIVAAVVRRAHGPQVSTLRAERRRWCWCRSLALLLLAGCAVAAGPARAEEQPTAGPPPAPEVALPAAPDVPAPASDVAAAHDGTAASSTPIFVIEKIVIEGIRHGSERIVAAETLLTVGRAYTEKQLQQALHRVERLPFVVEADFALRKGTERGRFELVIKVVETEPLFFGGTLGVSGSGGPSLARYWDVGLLPELGGRLFVRGQSEISLTLNGPTTFDDGPNFTPGFALRYTHHNLLGRHLVGSLSLGADTSVGQEARYDDRYGSAELVLPLSRTSIVKAGISLRRSGNDLGMTGFEQESRRSNDSAELAWQQDTTDDPFAPRSGRKLAATLSYAWGHIDTPLSIWVFEPEKNESLAQDHRGSGATVGGSWFWPLASRLSFGVGGSLSAGETRFEGRVVRGESVQNGSGQARSVLGQLEVTLLGTLPSRPGTACWWELRGSLAGSGYENDFLLLSDTPTSSRSSSAALSLGIAYRGRWGIARLAFTYAHGLSSSYEPR